MTEQINRKPSRNFIVRFFNINTSREVGGRKFPLWRQLLIQLITLAIAAAAVVSLVLEPIRRACVLEGLGVFESLRRGWQLVRLNFLDVGLMWLLTLGIRLGVALAAIPVANDFGLLYTGPLSIVPQSIPIISIDIGME